MVSISRAPRGASLGHYLTWISSFPWRPARCALQQAKMLGLLIEWSQRTRVGPVARSFRTPLAQGLAPARNWTRRIHSLHRAQFDTGPLQRFEQSGVR